jgi:outer membrane biosynthesis protein TonB
MFENQKHFVSPRVEDRRSHARIQTRSLAYIEIDQVNGGLILNISEGGIAIQAAEIPGLVFPNMRFRLPKSEKWIEVSGKLIWEDNLRKEAGIQFVDLNQDARQHIQNWVYSAAFRSGLPLEQGRFKIIWEAEEPQAAANSSANEFRPELDSMFPSEKSVPPKKLVSAEFSPPAASRFKAATDLDQSRAQRQDSLGAALSEMSAPSVGTSAAKKADGNPCTPRPFDPPSETTNMRNLRAAWRTPESSIGSPVSPEPTDGGGGFTGFGYQPAEFEGPSGKWWIIVNTALLILLAIGAVVAIGPANVKSILLHHAPSKMSGVASPPLPPNASGNAAAANGSSLPNTEGVAGTPNTTSDVDPAVSGAAETSSATQPGYSGSSETAESPEAKVREFQLEHSRTSATGFHPEPLAPIESSGINQQQAVPGASAPPSVRTENPLGAFGRVNPEPSDSSGATVAVPDADGSQPSDVPSGTVAISSHFQSIRGAEPQPNSSLQIGKLAYFWQPGLPIEAARAHVEGTVILRATVDQAGTVESVQLVSGPPLLVPAAINAVRQWRYGQTILDGRAVESVEDITVVFRLGNTASSPR